MQSGISFTFDSPPAPPGRLSSLQKLGRLFGIKTGPGKSKGISSNGTTARLSSSPFPGPGSPYCDDTSRTSTTSHDTLKPMKTRSHHRPLHHSLSTPSMQIKKPAFGTQEVDLHHNGEPFPLSLSIPVPLNYDLDLDEKIPPSPQPILFSLLRDLEPSLSPKRIMRRPITPKGNAPSPEPPSQLRRKLSKKRNVDAAPLSLSPHSADANNSLNSLRSLGAPRRRATVQALNTIPRAESSESSSPSLTPFKSPSYEELNLAPIMSIESTTSDESETRTRRSISKVCRVLGGCPSNFPPCPEPYEEAALPPSPSFSDTSFSQNPPGKLSRRMSLTLSTLASLPARMRSPSHSRQPSSSLNHLGVSSDNISETSGEMLDDIYASTLSLISPILFNPPSPISPGGSAVPAVPQKNPSSSTVPPPDNNNNMKPSLFSSPSATVVPLQPTLMMRPRSLSHAAQSPRSRPSSRLFLQPPIPPAAADYGTELPVRANWMDVQPDNLNGTSDGNTDDRNTKPADWSGQWNQDDMQEVIRKLRNLR